MHPDRPYETVRRNLTATEISAREKVWLASQRGEAVALTAHEAKALWASILQTGKELSALRDHVAFEDACR